MVRAVFIRHGQSAANAGLATDDFALIPVTEIGQQQAEALAAVWTEEPSHIFHSPFLRTHQTAAPTIARFRDVDVIELPVHEFTNLEPARWNGTSPADREEFVDEYWNMCDASYQDGPGAESFAAFFARIGEAFEQLQTLPDGSTAYVFSHGFAMNMARLKVRFPEMQPQDMMPIFVDAWNKAPIRNTERMEFQWDGVRWQLAGSIAPADLKTGVANLHMM